MSDRATPSSSPLILGEFIALGTLYNDMGIDWMEINCSRLPSKGNMEQLRMINTNLNWSFGKRANVLFSSRFYVSFYHITYNKVCSKHGPLGSSTHNVRRRVHFQIVCRRSVPGKVVSGASEIVVKIRTCKSYKSLYRPSCYSQFLRAWKRNSRWI